MMTYSADTHIIIIFLLSRHQNNIMYMVQHIILTLNQTWDAQSQWNPVWKVESLQYKEQFLHFPQTRTCQ